MQGFYSESHDAIRNEIDDSEMEFELLEFDEFSTLIMAKKKNQKEIS